MKLIETRPFADPETAARKVLELANARSRCRTGRIHIEKINGPFLYLHKGTPAEYKVSRPCYARGWLILHESGAYVKFTEPGAALFA